MATAAEIRANIEAQFAGVRNEVAAELAATLGEATPKDTGMAAANWIPTLGEPSTSPVGFGAQESAIAEVIANKDPAIPAHVTNNVAYIGPLLAGHSKQAAPGWDLIAIDQAIAAVSARHDDITIDVSGDRLQDAKIEIRGRG